MDDLLTEGTSDRFPELDRICIAVYEHVLTRGGLPAELADVPCAGLELTAGQCRSALRTLIELRLLKADPDTGDLSPVNPDVASASLLAEAEARVTAIETEMARRREEIRRTREQLSTLNELYVRDRLQRHSNQAIDLIEHWETVRIVLTDAVAQAQHEVMTCQVGGGRPASVLAEALPRDLAMLSRGVRLRTLYQHTARFHLPTQAYVEATTAAGSLVRTLDELPGTLIIVDRSVAFLPDRSPTQGAIVVREPSLVAFLCDIFDQAWTKASQFGSGPAAVRAVTDSVVRTIVQLLADGVKDDVIARRLGMSIRTCRRHIADLMERLGANSRFQAGVLAQQGRIIDQGPPS
ncbi:helix-turn-helix domain-containing protein [Catellatospora tritici]|uniref:helix-turn-helix domain-containing protein n=1 Tax=Catellatospora tritici TaxID=2851566 RepID=UPI001C2D90CC|nr:helix-turn-helix transcriptional regulator [Catellatospora tritici]MBV1855643.1 helix-turn-helix transcriptional regulator [Catellatospora tritici]